MKGSSQNPIDADSFEVIDCDADSMEEEDNDSYVDSNWPFEDKDIFKWYDIAMERCKFTIGTLMEFSNPSDLTDFLYITEFNDYRTHLIKSFTSRHEAEPTPLRLCNYERSCFDRYKLENQIKTRHF